MRIVLLTSAHPTLDKRIFERQAVLLRKAGHDVHIVAPSDQPISVHSGVTIHGFARPRSYVHRLLQLRELYRIGLALRGDLYHLHDPDLLAIGWRIRRVLAVPVVYDAHEDFSVERRVLGLSPQLSRVFARVIGGTERFLAQRLDAVVCPHRLRLGELRHPSKPALFLPNYPPQDVFGGNDREYQRERSLVYSGLLSESRGAFLILDAAERMRDVEFLLLAKFMIEGEERRFVSELGRRRLANVHYRGFLPLPDLAIALRRAAVGIMPWRRTPQHVRAAQPSKLYEYMASGLPILAADLPVTREIVLANGCGLVHEPHDVDDFVRRAYQLLDDPAAAADAGMKGRSAFEQFYSYERAGKELLAMYADLNAIRARTRSAAQSSHS